MDHADEKMEPQDIWETRAKSLVFYTPLGCFEIEGMQVMSKPWLAKTGRSEDSVIVRPESAQLAKLTFIVDFLILNQDTPALSGFDIAYIKDILGLKLSELREMSPDLEWADILERSLPLSSTAVETLVLNLKKHVSKAIAELRKSLLR